MKIISHKTYLKPGILFIIPMIVLLSGCGPDLSSPEGLGKMIFSGLQKKEKGTIENAKATKEDMISRIERSGMKDEEKSNEKTEIEEQWAEMKNDLDLAVEDSWKRAQEEVSDLGLNWSDAKVGDISFEKKDRGKGLYNSDISVKFTIGERKLSLEIMDAMETERGWVLTPNGFRIATSE